MPWLRVRPTRAQSTAEYALVIAIVLAALVGMQTYIKRSLQAKLQAGASTLTSAGGTAGYLIKAKEPTFVPGTSEFALKGTDSQYEPYYAQSEYQTTRDAKNQEKYLEGGKVERDILADEATSRTSGGFQEEGGHKALVKDDDWAGK